MAKRHSSGPQAAATGARAFTGAELAKIYNFPQAFNGANQTIGIIELGGGYRPSDLDTYFSGLGIPTPTVIPVSVDGGTNTPTSASSADAEVVLDIQVAGAAAPGAKFVVYFAPNDATSSGFLDALTKAIHDKENNPSMISISWGGPESMSTTNFQVEFDKALQAAAMLGVTVCVASGDNGAADSGTKGLGWQSPRRFSIVQPFCAFLRRYPASGPHWRYLIRVSMEPEPSRRVSRGRNRWLIRFRRGRRERCVPAAGVSATGGCPPSLNPQGFKGRGVPDVSGDGDPDTGYNILVDGQPIQEGGTSAVAPLWAALIARINQKLGGRVGFVNPQIYSLPAKSAAFHDISVGNNRVSFQQFKNVGYDAGPGWDAASGLGSPDGTALSNALQAGAEAATPSSPPKGGTRKRAAGPNVRASAVATQSNAEIQAAPNTKTLK